jgi:hypothetical protein
MKFHKAVSKVLDDTDFEGCRFEENDDDDAKYKKLRKLAVNEGRLNALKELSDLY